MIFDAVTRARLRRGVDPWEVPGFYRFLNEVAKHENLKAVHPPILATIAPLIAEVRETDSRSLGQTLRAKMSERRLRRLLAARDREDLVHQLRGAVRLVGRKANVTELVETVAYWGESRRRRLAREFFAPEKPETADAA